jgi:hypothetical protein
MVSTVKSEAWELLNFWQDSFPWCDHVMRKNWIRSYSPFTLVESFGILWRKLVVHGKYRHRLSFGRSAFFSLKDLQMLLQFTF